MSLVRLKYVAKVIAGQAPSGDAVKDVGQTPFIQGCAEFGSRHPVATKYCEVASKIAIPGDWLISVRAPVGRLNEADQNYGIGRGLAAIRSNGVDRVYLGFLLQAYAKRLSAVSTGSTYEAVSSADIGNIFVPYPDLTTQKRIAAFLDRETARIDELIAKKERMLGLHKARRFSEISQVLSKGVRLATEWKHSGFDWMGEIPAHWQWVRMKDVCSEVIDCKNRTPPQVDESQFLVIRTTCIKDGHFVAEGGFPTDGASFAEWTKRGKPSSGDVLITREAPMGEACLYPDELEACLGQRMMLYRPNPQMIRASYIVHTIYSAIGQHYIGLRRKGSTVGHLRVPEVYNFPCLLPPLEEQDEILARLDKNLHTYGELETKVTKSVDRLKEYRAALITSAVTGQIDVDTYGKTGTPSARLDRIEEEMQA